MDPLFFPVSSGILCGCLNVRGAGDLAAMGVNFNETALQDECIDVGTSCSLSVSQVSSFQLLYMHILEIASNQSGHCRARQSSIPIAT